MTNEPNDFEITVPRGPMVCGYCGETENFDRPVPPTMKIPQAYLTLGYLELTGVWALGVGPQAELVVLAEARWLNGNMDRLPHLCEKIPPAKYDEYAAEIAAVGRRS
jgi:hypothetical protein